MVIIKTAISFYKQIFFYKGKTSFFREKAKKSCLNYKELSLVVDEDEEDKSPFSNRKSLKLSTLKI